MTSEECQEVEHRHSVKIANVWAYTDQHLLSAILWSGWDWPISISGGCASTQHPRGQMGVRGYERRANCAITVQLRQMYLQCLEEEL